MGTYGKGGKRLNACIVDGLNFLCVEKCKDALNQERRKRKERSGASGKVLKAWNHTLENGRRNWPWACRIPEKKLPHTSSQPDFYSLF